MCPAAECAGDHAEALFSFESLAELAPPATGRVDLLN
jgi:hypothetical protein